MIKEQFIFKFDKICLQVCTSSSNSSRFHSTLRRLFQRTLQRLRPDFTRGCIHGFPIRILQKRGKLLKGGIKLPSEKWLFKLNNIVVMHGDVIARKKMCSMTGSIRVESMVQKVRSGAFGGNHRCITQWSIGIANIFSGNYCHVVNIHSLLKP